MQDFISNIFILFFIVLKTLIRGIKNIIALAVGAYITVNNADNSNHKEDQNDSIIACKKCGSINNSQAKFCTKCGTPMQYDEIYKDYEILRCKPTDSDDAIKSAYKNLAKQYHPDTINGMGLADEFMQFSIQKFQEITNAYETIKRHRNFN